MLAERVSVCVVLGRIMGGGTSASSESGEGRWVGGMIILGGCAAPSVSESVGHGVEDEGASVGSGVAGLKPSGPAERT